LPQRAQGPTGPSQQLPPAPIRGPMSGSAGFPVQSALSQTAPTGPTPPSTEMPPPAPMRTARVGMRIKQLKTPAGTPEVAKPVEPVGVKPPEAVKPFEPTAKPIPISSKDEFDNLNKGDLFSWIDGMVYKKD